MSAALNFWLATSLLGAFASGKSWAAAIMVRPTATVISDPSAVIPLNLNAWSPSFVERATP